MRANRVPTEPAADDPSGVRIIVKFPSGSRLERRFSIKDTIEVIGLICSHLRSLLLPVLINF